MRKTYIGQSRDGRTNRWRITCDCGKDFEPHTTLRRYQEVECPKCFKQEVVDYNSDDLANRSQREKEGEGRK